ncbi:GIY-YIG nuclease family protein [Uruburuella testudinis]|uniref:GIY-YIG nuclease family protein n=1 Tax=Uruburuella testudinis TaxID=1282863 RepID=A0ABY4DS43_9NEIS|nr:GIY-YIG nuclease family protein [Uruburuella testudinis]UOO81856.1 GIY-YIG nuclease family protein [Uruburuella testudinis]
MKLYAALRLPVLVPRDAGWCVYLLRCDQVLYCGISNRPEARFAAHAAGKGAKFTRMHRPDEMRLVYQGLSRSEAMRLEVRIKRLTAVQKRKLWAVLAEYLKKPPDNE